MERGMFPKGMMLCGLACLMFVSTILSAQTFGFDWANASSSTPYFAAPTQQGYLINFQAGTSDSCKYVHLDSRGQVIWARDYGFDPENIVAGNGGLFGISHLDSNHLSITRFDLATGQALVQRDLNSAVLGGFIFNPWDYLRLAPTPDSGVVIMPSEYMCQSLGMGGTCAIKLNKSLQVVHSGGLDGVGNLNQFVMGAGIVRNNGDLLLGNYCRNVVPNAQSALLLQLNGNTGAVLSKRYLHYTSSLENIHVEDFLELSDRLIVLVVGDIPLSQGGGKRSYLAALNTGLTTVLWAKLQTNCNVTKLARGADGRIKGSAEGSVNAFSMNPDGSPHWAVARSGFAGTFAMALGTDRTGFFSLTGGGSIQEFHSVDTLSPGTCLGNPVTLQQTNISITNNALTQGTMAGGISTLPNPALPASSPSGFSQSQLCTNACLTDAYFSYSGNFLQLTFGVNGSSGTHFWTFGDGNSSTLASPSHTYLAPGAYTVCHVVTTACGSDTVCLPVQVCPAPHAHFVHTANSLALSFGNNSSGNGSLAYTWDFGDGNQSTAPSPSHTYAQPGTYQVCLIASNPCNADTFCSSIQVTCVPTISAFSVNANLYTLAFANTSSGYGSLSYAWDFGDGNSSNQASPLHTYTSTGSYTVCLIVFGACGNDTTCQTMVVTCPSTQASFGASTNFLSTTFTNTSTGGGTLSPNWFFGDGQTSQQSSPVHQYAMAGSYQACLVMSGLCGTDTICQTITTVCPTDPVADFVDFSTFLSTQFSFIGSTGSGPVNYHWDFGDGNMGTGPSPVHVYANSGTYAVCLVAEGICASDTSCHAVTIVCPLPLVQFTSSTQLATASFQNQSLLSGQGSFLWDFGNGDTSTAANPVHDYGTEGSFWVCLTATDQCGSQSHCDSLAITCPQLTCAFTFVPGALTTAFTPQTSGNVNSWSWDFGDGQSSTTQNAVHTFAQSGNYFVCLTVGDGCTSATSCQNTFIGVGVSEAESISWQIYPQPAGQYLDVEIGLGSSKAVGFGLEDAFGCPVIVQVWGKDRLHQRRVDITGLAAGIYTASIEVGEKVLVRKVVVLR